MISIFIGFLYWRSEKNSYFQESLSWCLFLSGLIGVVIGLMISGIGGIIVPHDRTPSSYEQIVAIGDSSGVEGQFFLGGGRIDDVQYYFFYKKNGSGFIQSKIPVDQAIIYETDDIEPHIMEYTMKVQEKYRKWFILDIPTESDIYIPVGSITRSFNLDLNQ